MKRDRQTLIDVARMYYLDNLDQGAIGERLGLSKSSVSRILAAAKDAGIIHVTIVGDEQVQRDRALEDEVADAFGLARAYVAKPSHSLDPVTSSSALASAVFAERAPRARRIGFGWGLTIQRLIENIPPMQLGQERVLTSLVGGMPTVDTAPSGNNMIVTLAEKSGTRAERFDAPAVVESEITWRALQNESSVRNSLECARATDLAFVGIGTFGVHTSRLVVEAMKLSDDERQTFLNQRPAGDMCGHYYSIDGAPILEPTAHRVIGLSLAELAAISTVVGIAAGEERLNGVLGGIATGALNILCLDDALARALLDSLSSGLSGNLRKGTEHSAATARVKARSSSDFELITCPNCGHVHA